MLGFVRFLVDLARGFDALNTEAERRSADAGKTPDQAAALKGAEDLAELILNTLDDDKAQDVVAIDLTGKSSVTDYMVVASGRSQRHVSALADHLQRALKESGHGGRVRVEGMPACDWVLIDAGDVVTHIFRPEVREFYNLEKLWNVTSPSSPAN